MRASLDVSICDFNALCLTPSDWNPLFTNAGHRHRVVFVFVLGLDRSGIGVLTLFAIERYASD